MAEPDWAEFERLGLYDPSSPRADERRQLLERYVERGVPVEDMVAAAERGRLVTLLSDRGIRPGRDQYTLSELAERVGLPDDAIRHALRVSGLPAVPDDLPYFGDQDVTWFEAFRLASELFGHEQVLHFLRSIGLAASRVAAGVVTLASVNFSGAVQREGTERELSEANEMTVVALQTVPQVIENLFRHHVEHEVRRALRTEIEPGSQIVRVAVGFLDLVEFTSAVARMGADDLVGAVSGFEALAGDIVAEHGARVVKVIGDEAMYVAYDPATACAIALEVSAAVGADPSYTAVRGGITYGEVVALDGDLYGNEVNLAARAVVAAAPGQVLVSKEVAVADGVTAEPVGAQALKGFADPVDLFALVTNP